MCFDGQIGANIAAFYLLKVWIRMGVCETIFMSAIDRRHNPVLLDKTNYSNKFIKINYNQECHFKGFSYD